MALAYDFYENPVPEGSKRERKLHARVVSWETMATDEIAEQIHEISSLSPGDVKAVLVSLVNLMGKELAEGKRIHLEGLGYFHLVLSCPPVQTQKEIRAESIHVKSVAFRPEIGFKARFKSTPVVRAKEKNHSKTRSETEIDQLLKHYFEANDYLTGKQFQSMSGLTRSTAARRLRQLLDEGKLQKAKLSGLPLYKPMPGAYGR
ncbi:MAG: HU family DNA-binding protein [Tannerellaceae bacterium]|jgi:predicted histone-like DNA-binding protein|nr:HU family DNA-binding protein [Tannerellaceae bacterium]